MEPQKHPRRGHDTELRISPGFPTELNCDTRIEANEEEGNQERSPQEGPPPRLSRSAVSGARYGGSAASSPASALPLPAPLEFSPARSPNSPCHPVHVLPTDGAGPLLQLPGGHERRGIAPLPPSQR